MDITQKVRVFNRSTGSVSYKIDTLRVTRRWDKANDHIDIPVSELQELTFTPGGKQLLDKFLLIKNQDVCEFLELPSDPEYFYDENNIKTLLTSGTEDQLRDCLDFAPDGVIELLKRIAVELPLDSSRKRAIINKALNINIDNMILHNQESKEPLNDNGEANTGRRSAPITEVEPEKTPEQPAEQPASKYVYKRVNTK